MSQKTTRQLWSRIFAVILAIALPLTAISTWALANITNTDRWVATLHPLATDPVVTTYVAQQGAQAIVHQLGVQSRIESALPSRAAFLATTITTELEKTITKALESAIQTKAFQNAFDRANRITHTLVVKILDGTENSKINHARDVVLNVTPAIVAAIDRLDKQGITFLDPIRTSIDKNKLLVLKLLDEREIASLQRYYKIASTLRWFTPVLTILLALMVIAFAKPRRRGVRRLALTVTISAAVTYCLLRVGIAVAAARAPTPTPVAKAVMKAVTSFLSAELLWLTILGVVGLALSWFFGDSDRATSLRRHLGHGLRAAGGSVASRSKELAHTDWQGWSQQNTTRLLGGLRIADVAIGAIVLILLFWWVSTFWSFIVVAVLAILWYVASNRVRAKLSVAPAEVATGEITTSGETTALTESGSTTTP